MDWIRIRFEWISDYLYPHPDLRFQVLLCFMWMGFWRDLALELFWPSFFPFRPTHTHLWPSGCPFHPLQGRWQPPLRALAVVTDSTDGACKSIQQRLRARERERERERCTNSSMSEDYKLNKYESPLIPAPLIYSYQLLLLACVVVKSFQADEQFFTKFSVP